MKVVIENENKCLSENCYITENNVGVYGWYGLEHFEIKFDGWSKNDLYDLKKCIDEMVKEIEKLGG